MQRNKTKLGRTVSSGGGGASFEEDEDEFNKQQSTNKRREQQQTPTNNRKPNGLSTKVALGRLHDEIEKMLKVYELKWKEER